MNFISNKGLSIKIDNCAALKKTGHVSGSPEQDKDTISNSEEKLRLVMNAALDAIIWIDTTGSISFWNPQAEVIFGWTGKEALGQPLSQLIIPEQYRKRHNEGMALYLETGKGPALNKLLELSAIKRSGEEFPIELTIMPIKQGNEEFFCAFVRDITEKKKANKALQAAYDEKNTILESIADGFFTVDKNWIVTYWNNVAEKMLNTPKNKILGCHLWEVFSGSIGSKSYNQYHQALKTNQVLEFEDYYLRLDKWFEISAYPSATGLSVHFKDITERKRAEAALHIAYEEKNTVLERIDDGFFAVDENSIVTYWNKRAEILLNAERRDMIGKNLHEVFATTASKAFYDHYQKAIREKTTIHFVEFSTRMNKWFAVSAYASDNGLSVYFKDVTEQKNAEEKLKESELRYRSLVEQATDAICILDSSFRFIEVNSAGCLMFGCTKEDILQCSMVDVLFEEDLRTNPIKIDELKAGQIISNERRIRRKDGSATAVEMSSKMLEDGRIIIFGRDISARKESERQIKESESKYRSFFESSMDGILLTVTDGEILSANPAACAIFKMTEAEICAAGRFGLVDMEDPRVHALIEERKRHGRARGELRLVRKDGSKFEAEITSALFIDSYGRERTSMIVRDISESKEAELRVKQSNERYNLISQATNDMVWDWDLVTGKVYRNKEGWKKIFRTGDAAIENDDITDWDNRIHPEDLQKVQEVEAEIQKSERDFFEVECRMLRYDGTYAYIHDRGNIIRDEEGKAVRLIGATQDITARKEAELQVAKSELRFRSLVQNSSDIICIFNDRGYFKYSSPAITKILGFTPEETVEKNAFAFVHPDDVDLLKDYLSQTKPDMHREMPVVRFKNAQGEWRWIESRVTNMCDNPEVEGYVFNCRDITDRITLEHELENERQLKQQEITQAVITAQENERQQLGSELHDNINQILAGSRLYLGLAQKEIKDENPYLKETDTLITSAINEIRNLSHSLIAPAMHESELLSAIYNIIDLTQETSGINISLQAYGFDEASIEDKLKLSIFRIIQEQFNNILKHAGARHVVVQLIQEGTKTLLSIKDDGVGFDTTKKPTGVGLLNIKTRASLFNGELTIIASPGKGCELRVLFN